MWKDLFAPHILLRGYDYYLEDRVHLIERSEDKASAIVEGTEDYNVAIWFGKGNMNVESMECDCPYAEDGSHCKHEAALLYLLDDPDMDDREEYTGISLDDVFDIGNEEISELKSIIDQMPEDTVRDLLYSLAYNNTSLKNRIVISYGKGLNERQIIELKSMVDYIKYDHCDRSGFVDWRHASGYVSALTGFLHTNVSPLIESGYLKQAFDLTCHVLLTLGNTEIDDDGEVYFGAEACCDLLKCIADKADDAFQMEMYRWIEQHTGTDSVFDYLEDYLDEFRMNSFSSEELLKVRLEALDEKIDRDEKIYKDDPVKWRDPYWLTNNILNRIRTMEQLHYSKEEIFEYYMRYSYLPKVLLALAAEEIKDDNYRDAAWLLKDAKERNAENEDAVSEYSEMLIEIYRETGDELNLVEELLFNILNCGQSNLEHVLLLKSTVSEIEWPSYRDLILKAKTCSYIKDDFYKEEGMYEELMDDIERIGNISILERYEGVLRSYYPERIRDMYVKYVRSRAGHVSNRDQYRYLVAELKKLLRYPGGPEIAVSIAEQWKKTYSHRPAFKDELRKAGF